MNATQKTTTQLKPAMLAFSIAAALLAGTADAQPSTDEADEARQETSETAELERVSVTGTRIRRAGFDTLEPATVVTREYVEARGLTNIADALNEIPGFGVGVTPEGAQSSFGVGVNFVNRFGLGTARTLTLINGRRFVSANTPTIFGPAAPGLQVDLNTIPSQMVDRVENLAIGGAPTYGSDAIAGTVNILLRRDFDGLDLNATYGVTDQGDNDRMGASVVWGKNFADNRANITLALTGDTSDGVLQSQRDFFRQGLFFAPNPNAGQMAQFQPNRSPLTDGRVNTSIPFNTSNVDGIPNAVLIRNRTIFSTPPGGLLMPTPSPFNPDSSLRGFGPNNDVRLAFDRNGNIVPYDPGFNFGAVDASGGDGLRLWEQGQILSDLDRATFNGLFSYDLSYNTRLFAETTYYRAESLELVAQSIYNSPLFGALSAPLQVEATHPLLTPQAREVLAANDISSFWLSRASRDLVENNARGETSTRRAVVGLEGTFAAAGRDFDWEISANLGRHSSDFFQTVLNQQNFINAVNVSVNAAGQIVCDPTSTSMRYQTARGPDPIADSRCVPLDLFGEGRPSAEARNYVTDRTNARSNIEQSVFNANISSTLFDLWSGPLQYNIGFERRIEKAAFTPDEFQQ